MSILSINKAFIKNNKLLKELQLALKNKYNKNIVQQSSQGITNTSECRKQLREN